MKQGVESMYNLGISSVVETGPALTWSEEQLFELDQSILSHFDAVINLCTISDSIKKYGKTQQLKDLVGPSIEAAGITFSMEGLWQGIKDLFKWIWDKLKAMWNWFTGLFKSDEKKEKENIAAVQAAEAAAGEDGSLMVAVADVAPLIGMADQLDKLESASDSKDPVAIVGDTPEQIDAWIEEQEKIEKNLATLAAQQQDWEEYQKSMDSKGPIRKAIDSAKKAINAGRKNSAGKKKTANTAAKLTKGVEVAGKKANSASNSNGGAEAQLSAVAKGFKKKYQNIKNSIALRNRVSKSVDWFVELLKVVD